MEIKILGTGCPRCKTLYETTEQAIAELGLDATLAKEQDILKIIEYKVLGLPALVVDEKVVSAGAGLSLGEVKKLLTNK
ncbi:thioredoxin family protein [uncultured Alistipes sp.]|jgi:small redox-active disulfide protein 2|uniref:thioredoxin family protein n=1 Tax=uncultured Alistipes sp. TaxID=538949 RepID=UPI0025CC3341|nr:thioredoxin family protein [uncultured Alistipes sp.]